ncbi:MAG TPA: MFS transporter [Gaiellaceae bacterium]|nr:MFS transporter [Gaiellaceae bacterium]
MTSTPLWRNRDFVLLEWGRLLSTIGSASSGIAYPLLVLALTQSPTKVGIVSFMRGIPQPLLGLFAGVAADRGNRKRQMIVADVLRAAALASLGSLVVLGEAPWWFVAVVALVEGTGSTVFSAASAGALRAVVPTQQLPAAVGAQRARMSTTLIVGSPIGGALFQLGRAVPFLVDAGSYVFSIASLAAMRTPFQEERLRVPARLRAQLVAGVRFLWSRPFLRTCAFLYGLGNPLMPAILVVLVVVGRRQHLTGGEIGVLSASLGAAALVGSLVSPLARRALPIRTIMLLEFTTWFGAWLFVAWPSVYVLLAVIVPFGIAAPITDSFVEGYRIAMTPDELLGRAEAARSTITWLLLPLGPLVAGFLLAHVSARVTVAIFAAFALSLFIWGTLSGALRAAPSLAELADVSRSGGAAEPQPSVR